MKGNVRDDPEPFTHYCKKTSGCEYETIRLGSMTRHEMTCSVASVQAVKAADNVERVPCWWVDCDKTFISKPNRDTHVIRVHRWQPKTCPNGCDPAKVYDTCDQFQRHMRQCGKWPSLCRFPDCDLPDTFKNPDQMKRHLKRDHGVGDPAEQLQYFPPLLPRQQWVDQTCVRACFSSTVFTKRSGMRRHLIDVHRMAPDDADELINTSAQFQGVVHERRVAAPVRRKRASRAVDTGNKRPRSTKEA
jgi:hypothetical protein